MLGVITPNITPNIKILVKSLIIYIKYYYIKFINK